MALDLAEFFMEIEDSFRIRMPDSKRNFSTPRSVIDFVYENLPHCPGHGSMREAAFRFLKIKIGLVSSALCLAPDWCQGFDYDIDLIELFQGKLGRAAWKSLGAMLSIKHWPRLGNTWFENAPPTKIRSSRELLDFIIAYYPTLVKEQMDPWTRNEVAEVVFAILRPYVRDAQEYNEDSDFEYDMGLC